MSYYNTPIIQTLPLGNNALSYEQRKILGSSCELFIPPLTKGSRDDLVVSKNIGFEEVDHKGTLQSCYGLETLLEIADSKIPTYVIDNHNHALYLRYREYLAGHIKPCGRLVHIDQHADMGIPASTIDITQCQYNDYIATYTNEECNVGNFIKPALDSGLIYEVSQIRSVSKLEASLDQTLSSVHYILDIDIDFWSDHLPGKEEIMAVRRFYSQASMCTIALSPYFMNIEKAIQVVKMLFMG